MAGRIRVTVLKALELLQSIQEDDLDAEIVIESDTDVYDLHEDNCDDSEGESLSDNELLVSELSNSEISNFEDNETNSKTDEDHVFQNNTTSFATSDGITWDFLNPNQKNSGRRSCISRMMLATSSRLVSISFMINKNNFKQRKIFTNR